MPADLLSTDVLFPEAPEKGDERKAIQNILDYLYMLKEQLNYNMYNIGVVNFNPAELQNLSAQLVEPVQVDLSGLLIGQASLDGRVKRNEESIITLSQGYSEMLVRLETTEGKVTTLSSTTKSLTSQIADANGNISTLQQTAKSLTSRISSAEGNVSTLQQTAKSLTSRITSAEGDISTLEQTDKTLTSQISSANGNISTLQQTANSLTARIATAEGQIATLQVLPDNITARLETVEGQIADLTLLPDSLTARISTVEGDVAALKLTTEGYTTQIKNLEDGVSTLQQTVDGFSLSVSNMIDKTAAAQLTAAGFSLSVINDSGSTVCVIDKNGISIKNGGFTIYNSTGSAVFDVSTAGAITMKGSLTSGSSITSASITSGSITGATITAGSITGANIATSTETYRLRLNGTTLESQMLKNGTYIRHGLAISVASQYASELSFYHEGTKYGAISIDNDGYIHLNPTTSIRTSKSIYLPSNEEIRKLDSYGSVAYCKNGSAPYTISLQMDPNGSELVVSLLALLDGRLIARGAITLDRKDTIL